MKFSMRTMPSNRIVAGILCGLLLALLIWSVANGLGDLRTQIVLAIGFTLGLLYAILGRLPDWIVRNSGGSITADDDASNIAPHVYIPVLLAAIFVAIVVFCAVILL